MKHIYPPKYYDYRDPECPYDNYEEELDKYENALIERAEAKMEERPS